MSWLTGPQIILEVERKTIQISPFQRNQINPDSYDYRLGDRLKILKPNAIRDDVPCIDPKRPMEYTDVVIPEDGFLLRPDLAYLGQTVEQFQTDTFASLVTGKSSVGRIFVKNHACAGLIDEGFNGHITLEITAKYPTIVYPRMRFGQIFYFETVGEKMLYNGKYNDGNAATPSKIHLDWDH